MISLYRPGDSIWHRFPTGPKALTLAAILLAVSFVPSDGGWLAAIIPLAVVVTCYAVPGVGARALGRQLYAVRWLIAITLMFQLIFLEPQRAAVNTSRIAAVITIAGLLALTTPVGALMDAIERALRPLARVGVDPQRVALMMSVTVNALPALGRAATQVREAQRARGARGSIRTFVIPFLITALKHADDVGDALAARGVNDSR